MAADPQRSPWPTFVICATGAYITALDLSVVNVAFQEIQRNYAGASRAQVAWVVTAYNILFGSLLVAGGRTADRLGRRRVFLAGAATFGFGSALCALSPTLLLLIAGRAVQGLGAAFLTPATLGLLLGAFPTERRTQIVSLWGGIGALGVASGPTLGALLITAAGWRSAFWINLPICVAVIVGGRRILAETARQESREAPDYLGAIMITIALAGLALAISQSGDWGWFDAKTLTAFAVAAVIAPLFIRRQARHPEPVVDLNLFRSRSFAAANIATLLFGIGFAAQFLNNVLFLRTVWKYSVLQAGMASFLGPVTVALVSGPAGRLAARRGFRPLLVTGPVVCATAYGLFASILDEHPTPALWLLCIVVAGAGIGMTLPVLSSAAVSTLQPDRFAVGGAVNNTARQVGAVLGVALLVAVQGHPTGIDAALASFRHGWWFCAVAVAASGAVSLLQPAHRAKLVGRPAKPDDAHQRAAETTSMASPGHASRLSGSTQPTAGRLDRRYGERP